MDERADLVIIPSFAMAQGHDSRNDIHIMYYWFWSQGVRVSTVQICLRLEPEAQNRKLVYCIVLPLGHFSGTCSELKLSSRFSERPIVKKTIFQSGNSSCSEPRPLTLALALFFQGLPEYPI